MAATWHFAHGFSFFLWLSLRCFHTLIGVHLWSLQLTGHNQDRHINTYKVSQMTMQIWPKTMLDGASCRIQTQDCSRHRSGNGHNSSVEQVQGCLPDSDRLKKMRVVSVRELKSLLRWETFRRTKCRMLCAKHDVNSWGQTVQCCFHQTRHSRFLPSESPSGYFLQTSIEAKHQSGHSAVKPSSVECCSGGDFFFFFVLFSKSVPPHNPVSEVCPCGLVFAQICISSCDTLYKQVCTRSYPSQVSESFCVTYSSFYFLIKLENISTILFSDCHYMDIFRNAQQSPNESYLRSIRSV